MFPKAHAAAYVMMALRVAYFKVHHPFITTVLISQSVPRPLISRQWVRVWTPLCRMEEIAEKRKNNEASNVEIDLYTTLEIVNEMWERGFKFGKLDLYRSQATEFLIDGDILIPPFVAMDGLGENVAKQLVRA